MRKKLLYSLIGILVVAFGGLFITLADGEKPSLGLDLQGGISITQQPVGDYNTASLDLAVERIRERVDSLGRGVLILVGGDRTGRRSEHDHDFVGASQPFEFGRLRVSDPLSVLVEFSNSVNPPEARLPGSPASSDESGCSHTIPAPE